MTTEPDRVSLAFLWDVTSPRWNRRTFFKTMGFAAAAGFALAACGGDSDDAPSSSGADATIGPEPKQLNFYNWTEYIADETIPDFEKQTGIKVTYDNYASNDELFAKMRAGGTGYDLIVPTDSTFQLMNDAGLLLALDLSLIPNTKNLDERFTNAEYDPGNKLSIPWQWGTTGIGYDPSKVGEEITDWNAFDLASVRGKSSILDEARDSMCLALVSLGFDPNTLDEGELDQAKDYLIELKGKLKQITSDYQDPLKSGELILAHAYSGDVFQAQVDNEKLDYIIPTSGAFSWVDVMAIPKDAPHPGNAHQFMNFILDAEVGGALTNYVSYASPNKAAEEFIDKEILNNEKIYPPPDVSAKLVFQKNLGEDEILYADRWNEVKTA
jgi:spermidine/putrescine transport system substrate-binding protein